MLISRILLAEFGAVLVGVVLLAISQTAPRIYALWRRHGWNAATPEGWGLLIAAALTVGKVATLFTPHHATIPDLSRGWVWLFAASCSGFLGTQAWRRFTQATNQPEREP